MHGKVWMFSHLIDDEDIEFMQHEFISYRQAMDYYNLGYKPNQEYQEIFTCGIVQCSFNDKWILPGRSKS